MFREFRRYIFFTVLVYVWKLGPESQKTWSAFHDRSVAWGLKIKNKIRLNESKKLILAVIENAKLQIWVRAIIKIYNLNFVWKDSRDHWRWFLGEICHLPREPNYRNRQLSSRATFKTIFWGLKILNIKFWEIGLKNISHFTHLANFA